VVPINGVPLAIYYIIALLSVKYPSGVSRMGILPTGFLAKNAGDFILYIYIHQIILVKQIHFIDQHLLIWQQQVFYQLLDFQACISIS
jgi:hypothetical protein